MTARIIIADASRVSGLEFFDAVTGSSPAERARRKAEGAEFKRNLDEQHKREIAAMKERMLSMLSPERAAMLKAQWDAEQADEQLTECAGDPFPNEMQRKDLAA